MVRDCRVLLQSFSAGGEVEGETSGVIKRKPEAVESWALKGSITRPSAPGSQRCKQASAHRKSSGDF
jgi:hypothetical protein